MQISACMKRKVFSIPPQMDVAAAARLFVREHIGTLPVVDDSGNLVGILQLRDLLTLVMPDFVRLVEDFDFVQDFGAAEDRQPDAGLLGRKVSEVMHAAVSVEEGSGLMRAFALLHHHGLSDIPVVDAKGILVGIASRVDIGTAFLRGWNMTQAGEA